MADTTPLMNDFGTIGRLKKALEMIYGAMPEEVVKLMDEMQKDEDFYISKIAVLTQANTKLNEDLIEAFSLKMSSERQANRALQEKMKAEQEIAERDKIIAEKDRLIEAYREGKHYEINSGGIVVAGGGCNVMTKPVYGAQIQAGHGAVMNVVPQKPDPLDQRPPLVVAELPNELRTPQAIEYWQQMYDEGLVDNECQSLQPRRESAFIAKRMGRALGISGFWQMFDDLWGMRNLNSYSGSSLDYKKGWDLKEKLDKIFGKESPYLT